MKKNKDNLLYVLIGGFIILCLLLFVYKCIPKERKCVLEYNQTKQERLCERKSISNSYVDAQGKRRTHSVHYDDCGNYTVTRGYYSCHRKFFNGEEDDVKENSIASKTRL